MTNTDPAQPATARILLADDHRMIVDIFSMYLSATAGMAVTGVESFDEAAVLIQQDGPFDAVLLDLNMPGMNGVAGLRRAVRLNGGKPVAIITGNPTPRMLEEIMNAGAAGVILKTTPARSLTNAIRFILAGERYLPLELIRPQAELLRGQQAGNLTDKEMLVLRLLAEGRPNKEISKELYLAEPTVKMHVASICRKLGAKNRTSAAAAARNLGLV